MPESVLNISVVMPVYNAGAHVAAAVESILRQTYTDFEFVIVNDGSTDDTSRILKSFNDRRIRLVERENRGFAASLNQGIALARGRYIARMDGDDIAYPDRFERQYTFMEENPGVAILGGQAEIIDETGKRTGQMRCPATPDNIEKCLRFLCPMCHPTYFVRKELYTTLNGYRELPPVEDYDFLLRAKERGCRMANLPESVLKYRQNSAGMTANNMHRTLYLSAMVKKMHRLRTRLNVDDGSILRSIQGSTVHNSAFFSFVYNCRGTLMRIRKRYKPPVYHFYSTLIVLASLFHYQIALDSYHAFRAAPYRK